MLIIKYRSFFYALAALVFGASVAALVMWGLRLGIDFKGGSLMEISYKERPEVVRIEEALKAVEIEHSSIRTSGETGYIIRTETLTPDRHERVRTLFSALGESFTETRFTSLGPVLGKEAGRKSLTAIALVLIAILLFITFVFRKVSEPVSSWKYGVTTLVVLALDIIAPTGLFAFLGHFKGVEVDTLFVTALLVILGFSVHNSIVVFDRIRENLRLQKEVGNKDKKEFTVLVGESIEQTFVRSMNTSLTTLIALVVLYFVGGAATQMFALALFTGIAMGTFSSVFIGSPLIVTLYGLQKRA